MARTVFVTGASGFLAKRIIHDLLTQGDAVVASLRDLSRQGEVAAAVDPDGLARDRLRFVQLDLLRDDGWDSALRGTDALIHTASPFPISAPKDEQDLIRPAVEGTKRALLAARSAGVRRCVLTSSVAAIGARAHLSGIPFDEKDWSDLTSPLAGGYIKSKTLAERAAWEIAETSGGEIALSVINPSLILGTPMDRHFGSSVGLIERLVGGKDPMVPRFGLSVVDLKDVASAHVLCLDQPETIGERIIVSEGFLWMVEMARALAAAYPNRRFATRQAPDFLIRALALFDRSVRVVLPGLGHVEAYSNAKAKALLGLTFTPAREALLATAKFLIESDRR